MDAGDIDVYTQDRDHFRNAASVYIDVDDEEEDEGVAGGVVVGTVAYEKVDEDDMFADDDQDEELTKKEAVTGAANQPSTAKHADRQEEVDYASWSVQKLRTFLTEEVKMQLVS